MHATIAAFSMGIPTVPVAYSPKFFRLYSSLGYNRVIDGKDVDESEAVTNIIDCVQNNIETIKSENLKSIGLAKERNLEFKEKIKQILAFWTTFIIMKWKMEEKWVIRMLDQLR